MLSLNSEYITTWKAYLHGSSLNLVTPTEETRMILFNDEGNADTRFLTPSQSAKEWHKWYSHKALGIYYRMMVENTEIQTNTKLMIGEGIFEPVLSGVLSPSHLLDGKAVVPVQHITCVTPCNMNLYHLWPSLDCKRSFHILLVIKWMKKFLMWINKPRAKLGGNHHTSNIEGSKSSGFRVSPCRTYQVYKKITLRIRETRISKMLVYFSDVKL